MMNFPKNPTLWQVYIVNETAYVWDGYVWVGGASSASARDTFDE